MRDEGARGGAVLRGDADPDVHVAGVLKALDDEHALEGGPNRLGQFLRLRAFRAGQEDEKFIAPGTVEAGLGHEGGDGPAHFLEQQIALGVAEGFVEELEVADVEEHDGALLAGPQLMLEFFERGLPVGDVEQGVMVGHVLQLAGVQHPFGHVRPADEENGFVIQPADFPLAQLQVDDPALILDGAVLLAEDRALRAGPVLAEKGAIAGRAGHALGSELAYLAVGEKDFMALWVDDEKVGVHVVHNGLQGLAHLFLFKAAFLLKQRGVEAEAVGGVLVVKVDAALEVAGFLGAREQAGEGQGVVGGYGHAEGEVHAVGLFIQTAGGGERLLQDDGEIGHFAQGFVLISKEKEGSGAVMDGHVVFAGGVAQEGSRVLKEERFPARPVVGFHFIKVAEIDEDQGLQIEPGEQVLFNNSLPGFQCVESGEGGKPAGMDLRGKIAGVFDGFAHGAEYAPGGTLPISQGDDADFHAPPRAVVVAQTDAGTLATHKLPDAVRFDLHERSIFGMEQGKDIMDVAEVAGRVPEDTFHVVGDGKFRLVVEGPFPDDVGNERRGRRNEIKAAIVRGVAEAAHDVEGPAIAVPQTAGVNVDGQPVPADAQGAGGMAKRIGGADAQSVEAVFDDGAIIGVKGSEELGRGQATIGARKTRIAGKGAFGVRKDRLLPDDFGRRFAQNFIQIQVGRRLRRITCPVMWLLGAFAPCWRGDVDRGARIAHDH